MGRILGWRRGRRKVFWATVAGMLILKRNKTGSYGVGAMRAEGKLCSVMSGLRWVMGCY